MKISSAAAGDWLPAVSSTAPLVPDCCNGRELFEDKDTASPPSFVSLTSTGGTNVHILVIMKVIHDVMNVLS